MFFTSGLLNITKETNTVTKTIEGVPEGWELVKIGYAVPGDYAIGSDGRPHHFLLRSTQVYTIIRKKVSLEFGKSYKQVNGKVVGPMQRGSDSNYPFHDKATGKLWNIRGVRWCTEDQAAENIVEEYVPPKPAYRPFANAAEFKPHRLKWIQRKGDAAAEGHFRVSGYSEKGVHVNDAGLIKYIDLLAFTFEDGTPCGVKQ
jgi:hypothetical protein